MVMQLVLLIIIVIAGGLEAAIERMGVALATTLEVIRGRVLFGGVGPEGQADTARRDRFHATGEALDHPRAVLGAPPFEAHQHDVMKHWPLTRA